MPPETPARILFVRPDTYGDLLLFEPVLRIVRHAWPQAELGVLIRQPYADVAPLFADDRVRWLTTTCHPQRERPGDDPAAFAALREVVSAFAPDCVVAACYEQTWLEPAVATFLPETRQVSLGNGLTDPLVRASLDAVLPVDWYAVYPEKVPFAAETPEWEKNLGLASALLGQEAPRWRPAAQVPETSREVAAKILADAGLVERPFVVCLAAGTANVQIKCWPAEQYGDTLAWLEREHGIRALLVGHVTEEGHLEAVRAAAQKAGSHPALWTGRDGEMPVVAGLLEAARFCFGNDTGSRHLAAALGQPVVSIFGGGHWPRFAPAAHRAVTVVQPLPCFGCAWDCYFVDAPCVRTISTASVRRALDEFLCENTEGQTIFKAAGLEPGVRTLIETVTPRLSFLREDRAARGQQIKELSTWLFEDGAHPLAGTYPSAGRDATELTDLRKVLARDEPAGPLLAPVAGDRAPGAGAPGEAPLETYTDADLALLRDLRRWLDGETMPPAARAEARRLAFAHRLLGFSHGKTPSPGAVQSIVKNLHREATLLTEKVVYHFDTFQDQGPDLMISGWAFRPMQAWDSRATRITLHFRDGVTVYQASTTRVLRPDVAAHFAGPGRHLSGGARGLAGAGFTCEIRRGSLPAGVELQIALRLECAGLVCEQLTDKRWQL